MPPLAYNFQTTLNIVVITLGIITTLPDHVASQISTQPTYFHASCSNNSYSVEAGNYTLNSTYYTNLNLVLSDLVSHASEVHFYNSSAGNSNTTYAQYYCRGDISGQLCLDCIKAATKVALEGGKCFPIKRGLILFLECTIWYDYQSNVGIWTGTWTPGWLASPQNVSDPSKFKQVVGSLMNTMIKKAAYGGDPLAFAIADESVTSFETVYCLVQCSPDIVGSNCEGCLKTGLRFLANYVFGAEWGHVFYPNCQMRYSLARFYSNNSSVPPPLPQPTPPSVAAPPSPISGKNVTRNVLVPVVAGVGSMIFLLGVFFGIWFCLYKRKRNDKRASQTQHPQTRDVIQDDREIGSIECFAFKTIEEASMSFSLQNKLGEGGFGSVYKCILPNGHLVAIKRLSRNSVQGIREFKTEVAVVAKLQHRNLVRLLGFCVENEERILVYEYLPNLSLDKFLFDATKSFNLDWRTRYKIIEGIAWGLRYLHIDSLLTIVHRDLKSSNILLDDEMNPKITDFGLAKLVKFDEPTGNTSKIGGTFGYMAPEYALSGRFSIKSDIYSFGVIILEILSGKSICQFRDPINGDGLLYYAWRIWNEKAIEKLVDPSLQYNYSKLEAERCLQIAMLCVQDESTTRPTIRFVVGMLENQSLELPYPSGPSNFFRSPTTSTPSSTTQGGRSTQHSRVEFNDSSSNAYSDDLYPR